MQSHLLPVDHGAFFVDELPGSSVAAIGVEAADWLGELELLLDSLDNRVANQTLESALVELGLGVGGSSHSARDAGESAEASRPQLPDLGHRRNVVNGHLHVEVLLLALEAKLAHHLFESFNQGRLVSVELLDEVVQKLLVIVLVVHQVGEVDMHGLRLISCDFLRTKLVELE